MTQITSKVCIVGDFAVGKTSLVERFVNNQFSEKYLTTVGVKIDTKEVALPAHGITLKLVIWDVAGTDRLGATEYAYLRGAAGYLFVADGTRPATLRAVQALHDQLEEQYGQRANVLLINKNDLSGLWSVSSERIESLAAAFDDHYQTSAKTGENVEDAMIRLAERIAERELEG